MTNSFLFLWSNIGWGTRPEALGRREAESCHREVPPQGPPHRAARRGNKRAGQVRVSHGDPPCARGRPAHVDVRLHRTVSPPRLYAACLRDVCTPRVTAACRSLCSSSRLAVSAKGVPFGQPLATTLSIRRFFFCFKCCPGARRVFFLSPGEHRPPFSVRFVVTVIKMSFFYHLNSRGSAQGVGKSTCNGLIGWQQMLHLALSPSAKLSLQMLRLDLPTAVRQLRVSCGGIQTLGGSCFYWFGHTEGGV